MPNRLLHPFVADTATVPPCWSCSSSSAKASCHCWRRFSAPSALKDVAPWEPAKMVIQSICPTLRQSAQKLGKLGFKNNYAEIRTCWNVVFQGISRLVMIWFVHDFPGTVGRKKPSLANKQNAEMRIGNTNPANSAGWCQRKKTRLTQKIWDARKLKGLNNNRQTKGIKWS